MSLHCRKLNDMSYCSEYSLNDLVCGHQIRVLAICSSNGQERKFFPDTPMYEVTLFFAAVDVGVWQRYHSQRFGRNTMSQAEIDEHIAHYVDAMSESFGFKNIVAEYIERETKKS